MTRLALVALALVTSTVARANEPETDPDLIIPVAGDEPDTQWAPLVRGRVLGGARWRHHCVAPGPICGTTSTRPGITYDFTPSAPYPVLSLGVEIAPLASLRKRWLSGITLSGNFRYGGLDTTVVTSTSPGTTTASATDLGWDAHLGWRFLFHFSDATALGFVGLKVGLQGQSFDAAPPLLSSTRTFAVVSLESTIPIVRFFRIDLAASIFAAPRQTFAQVSDFGGPDNSTATGWQLVGGFSGQLWGPLEWRVQLHLQRFDDAYGGIGTQWSTCTPSGCTGVGQETYTTASAGLGAKF